MQRPHKKQWTIFRSPNMDLTWTALTFSSRKKQTRIFIKRKSAPAIKHAVSNSRQKQALEYWPTKIEIIPGIHSVFSYEEKHLTVCKLKIDKDSSFHTTDFLLALSPVQALQHGRSCAFDSIHWRRWMFTANLLQCLTRPLISAHCSALSGRSTMEVTIFVPLILESICEAPSILQKAKKNVWSSYLLKCWTNTRKKLIKMKNKKKKKKAW